MQLGIGQPTRLAEARRGILLLNSRFVAKRKCSFMMLARVTMVEGLLYGPDPGEFRNPLAYEKLVELDPPLPGLIR